MSLSHFYLLRHLLGNWVSRLSLSGTRTSKSKSNLESSEWASQFSSLNDEENVLFQTPRQQHIFQKSPLSIFFPGARPAEHFPQTILSISVIFYSDWNLQELFYMVCAYFTADYQQPESIGKCVSRSAVGHVADLGTCADNWAETLAAPSWIRLTFYEAELFVSLFHSFEAGAVNLCNFQLWITSPTNH